MAQSRGGAYGNGNNNNNVYVFDWKDREMKNIYPIGFIIGLACLLCLIANSADGAENSEIAVIRKAAERNDLKYGSENWYILLAIRKAENGGAGREFGIMNEKAHDLDSQAGWCAASIIKSRARWVKAGKPEGFVTFMGRRYCPPDDHPLNKNWVGNVNHWRDKLRRQK
jgi:hypothetical protein